ncbi:MAG: response regulator [Muribaculaceae bacterium]|nr:response regulator [Muribaculaceae bacterium]
MKTRFYCAAMCLLACLSARAAAPGYQFRHISGDTQLSSRLINVIFQDGGYVYFGTASGLDRYDGYSVKSYTRDDNDSTALHDSYVERILRAPDGRLWVRAGGMYAIFDPKADRFTKDKEMEREFRAMGIDGAPSYVAFDSEGTAWMAVDHDGLYRFDGKSTVKVPDPDGLLDAAPAGQVAELPRGRILYVNRFGNVVLVDRQTARICATARVPDSYGQSEEVYKAYVDREGLMWVYSTRGLWTYNPDTGVWSHNYGSTPLPQGYVMAVLQDSNGRMWIGYDHEGLVVLEKNGNLHYVESDPANGRTLDSRTVTTLMEDRLGTIWVGSRKNGVSLYNDEAFKFDFTPYPDVNCIAPDGQRLWLGTDGAGLLCADRNTGTTRTYDPDPAAGRPDVVVDVAVDKQGHVWAGTYGGGLLHVRPDGRTERITTADGLASDHVWAVCPLPDGLLMTGTLGGGLDIYDPATGSHRMLNPGNSPVLSGFVSSIEKGPDGLYYIGTASGVAVYNHKSGTLGMYDAGRYGKEGFGQININQVMMDSRRLLWMATREGLSVYDPAADSLYHVSLGRPRRFALGVAEDANHGMWAAVGGELASIAVETAPDGSLTFDTHIFNSNDGLQICDFNQRSLMTLPDGEMMVGGFYGINSFRPDAIRPGGTAPQVFFTGLSLFNEPVEVGREYGGRVLLPRRISDLESIELDHSDNEFSLWLATDDYVNPYSTVYYYQLKGFNDEWQRLPFGSSHISYTNLAPGHYTLHVKAENGDGVPSANVASLGIVVKPPFYATPVAKLVYSVLFVLLVLGALAVVRRHERNLSQRRERAEAAKRQEELDQLKFKFFTNVSHELRTPLTLIKAPLDSLLKKPMDADTRGKLEMVNGNAERLLDLVNQLLDFRKHEVAGMTLNLSSGDIVAFVRSICDRFTSLSEKKHIHLTFFSSEAYLPIEFDEDKMGKIIMNLLSNAFKFTPDNGRVDVALSRVDRNLEITVSDTGCGIPDEDKKRVFERYYQSGSDMGGTGIGLNLVAEYVKLHGGTVAVADNGVRGTVFTVSIPIHEAAHAAASAPATQSEAEPDASDAKLLVVDDNPDLLQFVNSELSAYFTVITASDGNDALAHISRDAPDLILSDLMMPGMDGIELCRRLKSDPATASIPLLILTAKHDVSAKIEGLTLGADDYMTKPFNIDELRLRLTKLLNLRRRGAHRAVIEPEPHSITITSLDEKLIEHAVKYVDDNMSSPDLSVEDLAAELGMSRVHLYKRLKQITGKTPIEFIRVLRLKRAAQMLRESQLNISEIAYSCGFNNPKYFSRYFKDEFGVLPSQYQEKESRS